LQLNYIGIDIGANGAIACLGDGSLFYDTLKDGRWISYLAKHKNAVVAIEDLHSIYGASAKSNFQFGLNNGYVIGVLETLKIEYIKVAPKKWQKEMWKDIEPVRNKGKVDTKATSLLAARLMYPNEQFLASSRSSVAHDGIVDAILIAHYAQIYDRSLRH